MHVAMDLRLVTNHRFMGTNIVFHQVVLQALDPMFEIADPHAAIIQGKFADFL